jgi:spermidine synthase
VSRLWVTELPEALESWGYRLIAALLWRGQLSIDIRDLDRNSQVANLLRFLKSTSVPPVALNLTPMFYAIVTVLAFCSIAYELLLGQILSAFLGNTVLRYSVTIGLYMLSMGIGAYAVRDKLLEKPVVSLQIVELILSIVGGFSLVLRFWVDSLGFPDALFSTLAHGLIILIGILSGMEIPLLIGVRSKRVPDSDITVLGLDYIGACAGALVFAFVLYPVTGLTLAAFTIAGLNALTGVSLIVERSVVREDQKARFSALLFAQALLLSVLCICVWQSSAINDSLVNLYLRN